jgi:hypothetical protein
MPRNTSSKAQDETAAPAAEVDTKAARVAMLVPAHARANYAQMVKDRAKAGDLSEDEARAQQIDVWRAQHEREPQNGWDVLADWLEGADLDEPELYSTRVEAEQDERVRAVLAAKADHLTPLDGFNEAEVSSILAHREAVKASTTEVLPDTNAPVEAEPAPDKATE